MPFAYYDTLTPAQQRVYRMSDSVSALRLREPRTLEPLVSALREALATGRQADTERATARLSDALCERLDVFPPRLEVLEVRPSSTTGELHGMYTLERGRRPHIQLWMRTAKHARVVAFRTFLRTLLHELGHHLDFLVLELPASFHTEGFFQREASLFHQLVPRPARPRRSRAGKGVAEDTPDISPGRRRRRG
ncbi:hypothetical protein [Corallococcus macrosporus]|uniref:Uncharacterized protein n=2 Tax=Myxococcaceae TaxID=31 RepID=A0A250K4E6_9BACT|nr:hypothetical protein [Corallococcus macrosporus]AEI64378.1 hypothetical protein LILAB_12355 [Corallococcus macrosporus]ATB50858.1 hypothetical protein MYMAC_006515 [Corallococcus macrosporus DSM 14697]